MTASKTTPVMVEGRAQVMARAGNFCEVRTVACDASTPQWHHRQSRRGGIHGPENGLAACRPCHDWVHAHPGTSRANGWIVTMFCPDPATVPVKVHGRWITLTHEGTYL